MHMYICTQMNLKIMEYVKIYSRIGTFNKHCCILRGRIKMFNRSTTTIMCEDGSYRTVVG